VEAGVVGCDCLSNLQARRRHHSRKDETELVPPYATPATTAAARLVLSPSRHSYIA
jgi:hypothetical protein